MSNLSSLVNSEPKQSYTKKLIGRVKARTNAPLIEKDLYSTSCIVCENRREAEYKLMTNRHERKLMISAVTSAIILGVIIGVSIGYTMYYWNIL